MAYNTQNLVGTGCYESKDAGLSDFGHEVVAEMNRLGILCDLSHVGSRTSEDVILASKQPVAYSHCLPAGLKAHPRNKSDEQLRFIVDHGGFAGPSTMSSTFAARAMSVPVPTSRKAMASHSSTGSPTTRAMPGALPISAMSSTRRGCARSA